MTRKKQLALVLITVAAAAAWRHRGRHEEAPTRSRQTIEVATEEVAIARRAPVPSSWRHGAGPAGIEPRERAPLAEIPEALEALTTAELDAQLDAVVGDAESYWELSEEARAQYDALEEARVRRLGLPEVQQRLEPWVEVLTLDGEAVTP